MEERRVCERMSLAASLEISAEQNKKVLGRGFITNLSEGGIAMETPKNLKPGDRLVLHVSLNENNSFDIEGEVVYSKEGVLTRAYGARFLKSAPELCGRIKDYLLGRPRR